MAVFRRMDKNGDGHLDVDEMHDVATMLGENIPKSEIKEMIKMFLGNGLSTCPPRNKTWIFLWLGLPIGFPYWCLIISEGSTVGGR